MFTARLLRRFFALAAVGCLGLCLPAQAASVFFGEDINATASGPLTEDAVRIPHPNSDMARTQFLANLQGVSVEDFETFSGGVSISSLSFGSDTADLTPALEVLSVPSGTFNGVYPISGDRTLLQAVGATEVFSVSFSSEQAAFGFYVTDLEIPGNLALDFLLPGGSSVSRTIPTLAGEGGTNNTGSVAFFGVIDIENPFVSVTFSRVFNAADGFGFDDITIGRVDNVNLVPLPASVWMLSVAMVSLIARRFTQDNT